MRIRAREGKTRDFALLIFIVLRLIFKSKHVKIEACLSLVSGHYTRFI